MACRVAQVMRSRTAMTEVDKRLLPSNDAERDRCARTAYVANIDKCLDQIDVCRYFEKFCGEIILIAPHKIPEVLDAALAPTSLQDH